MVWVIGLMKKINLPISLSAKLLLSLLILAIIITMLFSDYFLSYTERQTLADYENELSSQCTNMARYASVYFTSSDQYDQNGLQFYSSQYTNSRIRICNNNGYIIADSNRNWLKERDTYSDNQSLLLFWVKKVIRLFKSGNDTQSISISTLETLPIGSLYTGNEVRTSLSGNAGWATRLSPKKDEVLLYYSSPILIETEESDSIAGVIIVSSGTGPILAEMDYLHENLTVRYIQIIFLLFAAWFILFQIIVKPIQRLKKQIDQIRSRNGKKSEELYGTYRKDEIGELSRSFSSLFSQQKEQLIYFEDFSSDVSHELKNPLASITSAVEMLPAKNHPDQKYVNIIKKNTIRMESMLNQIRDFSKIDGDLSHSQFSPMNLQNLLEELLEVYRLRFPKVQFTLNQYCAPNENECKGNPDTVAQALINLIDNGLSFLPPKGKIIVSCRRITKEANRSFLKVSIFNNGPVISEEIRKKIFDRFYSDRKQNDSHHMGLGLTIVKKIMTAHGGEVGIEQTSSEGTTFYLVFPSIA